MRLVIHSQGAAEAGLRRYNGQGIFSSIGRKLFSFGLKKVINAVEKENRQHRIADALVNGLPPARKKKEKTVNVQQKKRKRKLTPTTITTSLPSSKARKYSEKTINQLINTGSGIILD